MRVALLGKPQSPLQENSGDITAMTFQRMWNEWARQFGGFIIAILIAMGTPTLAGATTLQFDYGTVFFGGTPSGSAPWLTAIFTDVSATRVDLTITLNLQSATEYLNRIAFNLDPSFNVANLTPTNFAGVAPSGYLQSTNGFSLDGGGLYDLRIAFAVNAFAGTSSSSYHIDCAACPGFNGLSFNFISAVPVSNPPPYVASYLSAARVDGIGGLTSDAGTSYTAPVLEVGSHTAAVPEPASLGLLLTGLGGLGWWRYRQRKAG